MLTTSFDTLNRDSSLKKEVAYRLRQVLDGTPDDLRVVALNTGISKLDLLRIKEGRINSILDLNQVILLSQYFKVDLQWLLTGQAVETSAQLDILTIPIIHSSDNFLSDGALAIKPRLAIDLRSLQLYGRHHASLLAYSVPLEQQDQFGNSHYAIIDRKSTKITAESRHFYWLVGGSNQCHIARYLKDRFISIDHRTLFSPAIVGKVIYRMGMPTTIS